MMLNRREQEKGQQLKLVHLFFMWVISKSGFSLGVVLCSLATLAVVNLIFLRNMSNG